MLRDAGVEESPEALMLVSQYLDAMVDVSHNGQASVLYMPSNPQGMGDLFSGMRDVLMANRALDSAEEPSQRRRPQPKKPSRAEEIERESKRQAERAKREAIAASQRAEQQRSENQQEEPHPQQGQHSTAQPQAAREYFQQLREQLKNED